MLKTKYKVLIALVVIAVLGLIGFLVWWFYYNNKMSHYSPVEHLRELHNKMDEIHGEKIDLPIIYINMDDATERRELMEDQLNYLETPVVRVPGVRVSDGPKRAVKGCFLAHLNAMRELLRRGWNRCLILEDDASLRLSSRWKLRLSQLEYPSWLSQGTTAYIIDRSSAQDFIEFCEGRTDFSEGVDTIMFQRYGDNPMNDWVPFKKKGWSYYYYVYPMIHLTLSQIHGTDSGQTQRDAKRAVSIIKCSARTVASLTTIPPRLPKLESVLRALTDQPVVDVVYLNLPYVCAKTGTKYDPLPAFLSGMKKLKVQRCEDYGPLTKLLPTLESERDPSTVIIVCDDDMLYKGHDWATGLVTTVDPVTVAAYDTREEDLHFPVAWGSSKMTMSQAYKGLAFQRRIFEPGYLKFFLNLSRPCKYGDDFSISYYLKSKGVKMVQIKEPPGAIEDLADHGMPEMSLREGTELTQGNHANYKQCKKDFEQLHHIKTFTEFRRQYDKAIKEVFRLLSSIGVEWWPTEGTLIGILRYGHNFARDDLSFAPLGTDSDIDIMVRVDDDQDWDDLRSTIKEMLSLAGWARCQTLGVEGCSNGKFTCSKFHILNTKTRAEPLHLDLHRYMVDSSHNLASMTRTKTRGYPFQYWGNSIKYRGGLVDDDGRLGVAVYDDIPVPCPLNAVELLSHWNNGEYNNIRWPFGGMAKSENDRLIFHKTPIKLNNEDKRILRKIWDHLYQKGYMSFSEKSTLPSGRWVGAIKSIKCRKGRERCYGKFPQWKENNKRTYKALVDKLLSMGKHPFLCGGGLLGYARQNDLLDNDDDMNIGLFDDELDSDVMALLGALGYSIKVHETKKGKQLTITKGDKKYDQDIEIDIEIPWRTGGMYYSFSKFLEEGEQYMYRPYDLVFDKMWGIYVPTDVDGYLRTSYGEDWRFPDPNFNYLTDSPGLVKGRHIRVGSTDPFPYVFH